jgi:Domain of unknown function (DUF2828)
MSSTIGAKGSDIHTHDEVGDSRVVLASLLVRGASEDMIREKLTEVLHAGHLDDAFVLAFMNRNIRGGKGERDLFYTMFIHLYKDDCELTEHLLDLVPHFGYWGDVFTLVEKENGLKNRALSLTKQKLAEDEAAMAANKPASLLAKWIPREGKPLAKDLANILSKKPLIQARLADYRKRVSALNKYLQTTEIAMCGGDWESIKPERVPGRCMKLHTKAFLNEQLKGRGLRKPEDESRMNCREHFQTYFAEVAKGKKVAKGADTLYPHEVIRSVTNMLNEGGSGDERNSLIGAWNAFVVKAKEGGGLGRSIPMCDFSGSMGGGGANGVSPLEVSRALGLLISEVTTDAFKHKMLTFDSTPQMVDLPKEGDIFHKVEYLNRHSEYGHGFSTDFQKAMELVLDNLVKNRVPVGQEPENLIVLTDMAWDAACGSNEESIYTGNSYSRNAKTAPWQTHIQMIRENFKRVGEDMWGVGKGYTVPRIVIWNIANSCADMHSTADTEGVVMLSGWSSAMFKVLMAKGVEITTPYKALRYQLDDEMYDVVRDRIRKFLKDD